MTESATNVVVGFRTLRIFCENVGELLIKSNEMMNEAGWKRIGHTPIIDISHSLDYPSCWLPDTFFCYYEHADSQNILPFVAVFVDDLWADDYDPNRVTEPLASAGWAEYPAGTNAKEMWAKVYRVHYTHLWMKDRLDNGTLFYGDARDIWEDEDTEAGTIRITTFAYPLEVITDSEILKEKIVQPLLDLISQDKS